jgi:release factor glutamine methyltransferase
MDSPRHYRSAVEAAVVILRPTLGQDARFEAELLLAATLSVNRAVLVARAFEPLGAPEYAAFMQSVQRRAQGEPFAYVTGRRSFWTLDLAVTADVLVPRPETERLVERVLELGASYGQQGLRIADLGTGSGAIALAIASARPHWRLIATDISPAALDVARANAARYVATNIEFREGAWFAPIAAEQFQIIASNPPYVAADDPALAHDGLQFEPRIALTPGDDALAALREIVDGAPRHLLSGGYLLLEHGATQSAAVQEMLVSRGFDAVVSHADLAGRPRVTEARWTGR